ncbi:MAG: hypothetical protein QOH70_4279 [Blastocatellia bacterium]|jgi:hypothetical protein|nr:hypothetical protein [Blastocatellia bacterium]
MLKELVITAAVAVLASQSFAWQQKPTNVNGDKSNAAHVPDKRLDHIKLEIHTVGGDYPYEEKSQYSAKDPVSIRVLANNSGQDEIVLPYVGSFVHYLPQLIRAGKLQGYSEGMQKRLSGSTKPSRVSGSFAKLPPNQLTQAAIINLSNWFGSLEPAIYNLKLKYRLYQDGPEVESNTVIFEVTQ